jgi:hypothetical protein
LLAASAQTHRSTRMQCNAGARNPALLRFGLQVAGGDSATPRPVPIV